MSARARALAQRRRELMQRVQADRLAVARSWYAIEEPVLRVSLWWYRAVAWACWLRTRPWLWALPLAALLVVQARRGHLRGPLRGWWSMALPWLLRSLRSKV